MYPSHTSLAVLETGFESCSLGKNVPGYDSLMVAGLLFCLLDELLGCLGI